jgi:hypothetical protein
MAQAQWIVRVIGKQRREIDTDLLVQAILALGRQLWNEEQARQRQADMSESVQEESE